MSIAVVAALPNASTVGFIALTTTDAKGSLDDFDIVEAISVIAEMLLVNNLAPFNTIFLIFVIICSLSKLNS